MNHVIYLFLVLITLISCNNNNDVDDVDDNSELEIVNTCLYENLAGMYLIYTESDTSERSIEISPNMDGFETNGISGYDFWFPAAPLSGNLNDCEIIIDSYEDVEREGLPSPGGTPRYYYESMNGFGEFYPIEDSIVLNINYKRTGIFTENFSGNIYLKKME